MTMTWNMLLLGVVQGLTEFLPVSSSGHLVVLQSMVGFDCPGVHIEVVLHGGTLLSILVFYRARIAQILWGLAHGDGAAWRYAIALSVATIPTALVYLAGSRMIERMFDQPEAAFGFLGVTGVALLSLWFRRTTVSTPASTASGPPTPVTWIRALWVGAAQAVAMLPGISRSGATIVTARHLGVPAKQAAEFSMLMSIPVLTGAIALTLFKLPGTGVPAISTSSLVTGTAVSAVVGYMALWILVRVLSAERLWLFGIYCLVVAATGILVR